VWVNGFRYFILAIFRGSAVRAGAVLALDEETFAVRQQRFVAAV